MYWVNLSVSERVVVPVVVTKLNRQTTRTPKK